MMEQSFELQIGELKLWRGNENAAQVAYGGDLPIVISHSAGSHEASANLLEALALQLWRKHTDIGVSLAFYEPYPSPFFANIKRVLKRTSKDLGVHLLDRRAFDEYLTSLLKTAHRRFSLFANLGVDTLDQYNDHPEVFLPEKIELLLISELPIGFTNGDELKVLETLCSRGPSIGIIPILLRDINSKEDLDSTFNFRQLCRFWDAVQVKSFGFDWSAGQARPVNQSQIYWRSFVNYGLLVGVPASSRARWAEEIINSVAKDRSPGSQDFLDVLIGHCDNVPVHFRLGTKCGNYHALIIGVTGSGKTTLLHNVLLSACERYSPEQLRLWIIDPTGKEFTDYEELAHIDFLHFGTLTADQTQEMRTLYGALTHFEGLIEERSALFRSAGVRNISEYNQSQATPLPYCIFIVDEAPELLNLKQWLNLPNGRNFLDRVVLKGRSFGLHLILLSQSFVDVKYFPDTVKDSFTLRIAGRVSSEAISRNFFGFGNDAAAHLPMDPNMRMAIVNQDAGRTNSNQVVHLKNLLFDQLKLRSNKLRIKYPIDQYSLLLPTIRAIKDETSVQKKLDGLPDYLR